MKHSQGGEEKGDEGVCGLWDGVIFILPNKNLHTVTEAKLDCST